MTPFHAFAQNRPSRRFPAGKRLDLCQLGFYARRTICRLRHFFCFIIFWLSRAMHALYGKISRRFQSAGNTARLRCNIPFICAMRIPKFVMGTPCCIAWRSLDCSARGGSIQAPQWTTSR